MQKNVIIGIVIAVIISGIFGLVGTDAVQNSKYNRAKDLGSSSSDAVMETDAWNPNAWYVGDCNRRAGLARPSNLYPDVLDCKIGWISIQIECDGVWRQDSNEWECV
ncbi:hypothetical protein HOA59_01850 [archaeon]|jgi:hypothetical protein|nr:hypothetical protein [archaeon]MBT6824160.1 hypothetical protein [archaeon]MBT7106996.1 hypothetical protein [archaeon]MBT7297608.1 hypothetical protein [archaeon]